MAVCQNRVPLVNIKIAGKWMFIPLKMLLIGIDPYPYSFKSKLTALMNLFKKNVVLVFIIGFTRWLHLPSSRYIWGVGFAPILSY